MTEQPRASATQVLGSGPALLKPAETGDASAGLPRQIGHYAVLGILGEGGMGTVYECHDTGLDRSVAIKVLRGELAADPEMKSRFLREARAMARVASPHVVAVHAVGDDNGAPFIVMERLEGQDLSERLRENGPLSSSEMVSVLLDAVAGLSAAALRGLIHRDVKPANLFLVGGRTKITDFGLARPMDGSASVTQAGLIVGTPHYMAPELGRGAPATVASDIYALGATSFELLSGRPPFTGATPVQALAAHILEPTPCVLELCPTAAPELAALIERMLAKQPEARFNDYADLDRALRVLSGAAQPIPAVAASGREPPESAAPPTAQPSIPALRISGPHVAIKTRSLAVMMTDIAGYSERTGQQSREESARWLALHDQLLLPILRAFGGNIVKNIGDALLVTFGSPTDAVLCGTAIQDRLFLHNRDASPSDRIEVRIAISAGEVRVQRGDIFGEPVNLAARLESIGERGEILITDAVYATMNTAEVALAPRGVHTFKGIQRAVQVYAATADGVPGALPFGGRALARAENAALPERARRWLSAGLVDVAWRVGAVERRTIGGLRHLTLRSKLVAAAVFSAIVIVSITSTIAGSASVQGAEREASGRDTEVESLSVALDAQDAEAAKSRLVKSADDDLDEKLRALARTGSWWQRHHAIAVLDERAAAFDREAFGIQDLEEGSSCARRRMGLMLLKRAGASDDALAAIHTASRRQLENACMLFDFARVEELIRARVKQQR